MRIYIIIRLKRLKYCGIGWIRCRLSNINSFMFIFILVQDKLSRLINEYHRNDWYITFPLNQYQYLHKWVPILWLFIKKECYSSMFYTGLAIYRNTCSTDVLFTPNDHLPSSRSTLGIMAGFIFGLLFMTWKKDYFQRIFFFFSEKDC